MPSVPNVYLSDKRGRDDGGDGGIGWLGDSLASKIPRMSDGFGSALGIIDPSTVGLTPTKAGVNMGALLMTK
jgi:hypothetical protein